MNRFSKAILVLCMVVGTVITAHTQGSQLAATPPMGWNSWNHFDAKIDDATIRAQADAMVSSGMRDAGYVYINIDDGWGGKRAASGKTRANEKFPDMKALADYIHSKGLKLGIYSSPGPAGTPACSEFESSFGHEEEDARVFAEWGVDFLKYDLCGLQDDMAKAATPEDAQKVMADAYRMMQLAIKKTGRPMVFSLCQYGIASIWKWGVSVGGNMWRTTGDVEDKYTRMAELGFGQAGLARYAGPGHWNDPDMLEVGNGGMTTEEYRTQMSLWSLLAAPLIAGNDLTKMSPDTYALLTNREVIAIDQDPAGIQGDRLRTEGPFEIWVKPLADGSKAVGLFNRQDDFIKSGEIDLNLAELGLGEAVQVRDLWKGKDLGLAHGTLKSEVPAHGVVLLRVYPVKASR